MGELGVGRSTFVFEYSPAGGERGTLAMASYSQSHRGVIFRYKVFIQRRGGDFVQWGETGNVCKPHAHVNNCPFGPDVPDDGNAFPQGIFGLSHKALLDSEYLENDTLTVRFELEVRLPTFIDDCNDVANQRQIK